MPYLDEFTNIEQSYAEWAQTFTNEHAVAIYHCLVEAYKQLKKFGQTF